MSDIEEDIKRCEKLTEPQNANWIGISNQMAIAGALARIKELEEENIQLKKQIDLMAEYIDGDDTSLANYLCRKNGKCNKEMIKQYFERKARND